MRDHAEAFFVSLPFRTWQRGPFVLGWGRAPRSETDREKWLVLIRLDELLGLIGQPIGEIFPGRAFKALELKRRVVARLGPTLVPTRDLDIEALP